MNFLSPFAVLFWGGMTALSLMVLGAATGSTIGLALAFVVCGLTYIFQTLDYVSGGDADWRLMVPLWAVIIVAAVASAAFSTYAGM